MTVQASIIIARVARYNIIKSTSINMILLYIFTRLYYYKYYYNNSRVVSFSTY